MEGRGSLIFLWLLILNADSRIQLWDTGLLTEQERKETCQPVSNGYQWVLSQRREDHGWSEQTHRAIIVLAINDFRHTHYRSNNPEETLLREHQLEYQLTKALFRNETHPMLLSDLALYIHALIITYQDPRNFHDLDLVDILKYRFNDESARHDADDVNMFALLVLADSRAIEEEHLTLLLTVLNANQTESLKQRRLKSGALHALACAIDIGEFQQYSDAIHEAAAALAKTQNPDGSFGNLYTTSLIMQALTAARYTSWDRNAAGAFLLDKWLKNVNMVSTYYVEKASYSSEMYDNPRCLKTLYPGYAPSEDGLPLLYDLQKRTRMYYILYSLRVGEHPDVDFTITMKVPNDATFFDIMRLSEEEDPRFRFSWDLDESDYPTIYSISGIPNDAEESLYWRLVIKAETDDDRNETIITEFTGSPIMLIPEKDTHVIFWFREAFNRIDQ